MKKSIGFGLISLGVALALVAAPALAATRSANFAPGDRIVLVTKVNVRSSANGTIVGKQTAGVFGTLIGGPINANGYTWWDINYDTGTDGWSAEDFLQKPAQTAVTKQSELSLLLSQLKQQANSLSADVASVNIALQSALQASVAAHQ